MSGRDHPWQPLLSAARNDEDVIDVLALSRFAAGEHVVSEVLNLGGVGRLTDLVPIGSVVRAATVRGNQLLLAEGDGWSVNAHRFKSGWTWIRVSAVDDEVLAKTVAAVRAAAPQRRVKRHDVAVDFWFRGSSGPEYRTRRLEAPKWATIARNYPAATATALEGLTRLDPSSAIGRLLVWHGPPGTGKTTATRALLRAWRRWCRGLVVTDPDHLFQDPSYLMELLLDDDGDRWRLLVIEDADELLRPDARERSGAVLARLLNASDGLIGQGLQVLVLLTTNQPRVVIDPALLRPGRCLAEVAFERFDRDGADAWLEGVAPAGAGRSLAELYRLRSGEPLVEAAPSPGQYL